MHIQDEIDWNVEASINRDNGFSKNIKYRIASFFCFIEDSDYGYLMRSKSKTSIIRMPHYRITDLEQIQTINRNNYLRRRCNKIR